MEENLQRYKKVYKPRHTTLYSAMRSICVDSNWENMDVLAEAGWRQDGPPPAGSEEPEVYPHTWWDQRDPPPETPHPKFIEAMDAAASRRGREPEIVKKSWEGGSDPLIAPDKAPLPKGVRLEDIKPKALKIKQVEEKVFREHNPNG